MYLKLKTVWFRWPSNLTQELYNLVDHLLSVFFKSSACKLEHIKFTQVSSKAKDKILKKKLYKDKPHLQSMVEDKDAFSSHKRLD